jgi:hypothetical protein
MIVTSCYPTMSYCLFFALALSQLSFAQSPSATTAATPSTSSAADADADVAKFGQKINILGLV